MGKYRTQVERGAELLDEKRPGWREWIDVDKLDVGSCYRCVLGQVLGNFRWRAALGLSMVSYADSERCGFVLDEAEESAIEAAAGGVLSTTDIYAGLTDEWRAYLWETRAEVSV